MENRSQRKVQLAGAMLALGSATFVESTFLSEGGSRWVGRCVAGAFFILALVIFVKCR